MVSVTRSLAATGFVVLLAGCISWTGGPLSQTAGIGILPGADDVRLELVAGGLDQPVGVTFPPGGEILLWVVEKGGLVRIVWNGSNLPAPALDVRDQIETGFWEQGLQAMVFHPEEPRVFVLLTPPSDPDAPETMESIDDPWGHRIALVEYPYDYPDEVWQINASRGKVLLEVEKPREQHNGGGLAFGPDGHLYVALGEGGFSELAQRNDTLLGSILRLDVSTPGRYAVPPDNPFVGDDEARGEIWQTGLRNPWKIAFDSQEPDLWVTDVGGSVREEINRIPVNEPGGNYGWGVVEGDVLRVNRSVDPSQYVGPVFVYETHSEDPEGGFLCGVIGGMVYRGESFPPLQGRFIFSDLCSGSVYALHEEPGENSTIHVLAKARRGIVAVMEDQQGEILLVNHDYGTVRRVVPD